MTSHPIILPTDPKASYLAQKEDIEAAIRRVLESGYYILGKEVAAFEAEFAALCQTSHAVGCGSGTDAIVLALEALGVGPGDGVVTVAQTAIATVAAIEMTGAIPILVDIDEAQGMDPAGLAAVLAPGWQGPKVKAIIPVHLQGQSADLDALMALAARQAIPIIEDCSHAHGAHWHEKPLGSIGRIGIFSLYPTKNLGAIGDAGIITTQDAALAERMRGLRQYGWQGQQVSDYPGRNSRLDEMQAAILRVRLQNLVRDNQYRQKVAAAYDAGLAGLNLTLPLRRAGADHIFHQYVIDVDQRDRVRAALGELGVKTLIHYPVPAHRHPAYQGRLPIGPMGLARTDRQVGRILSLPMYPHLPEDHIGRVIDAVRQVVG